MNSNWKTQPVVCGYGGMNASGRSFDNFGYKRLVYEALSEQEQLEVLVDLLTVTQKYDKDAGNIFKQAKEKEAELLKGTLTRKTSVLNIDHSVEHPHVHVAAMLPDGVDISKMYPCRGHQIPLQLTIFSANQTLDSIGMPWSQLQNKYAPDKIATYCGGAIAPMEATAGWMLPINQDKSTSPRALSMSLAQMPADFVNAYVLGSCGETGNTLGACATFLYNLNSGLKFINSGGKFALIGSADQNCKAEIADAFYAMGAITTDQKTLEYQKSIGESDEEFDYTKSCQPFATSHGMSLGDGGHSIMLTTAEIALENGLPIYGVPLPVNVNADSRKGSISRPGVGNYVCFAKNCAYLVKHYGLDALQNSVLFAHEPGTLLNGHTETHVFHLAFEYYGVKQVKTTSLKGKLGHTMGGAAADQFISALGVLKHNIIPGVGNNTLRDDLYDERLDIITEHRKLQDDQPNFCMLNAKGFGGNNASATLVSKQAFFDKFSKQIPASLINEYQDKLQQNENLIEQKRQRHKKGEYISTYLYNQEVLDGEKGDVWLKDGKLYLKSYDKPVEL